MSKVDDGKSDESKLDESKDTEKCEQSATQAEEKEKAKAQEKTPFIQIINPESPNEKPSISISMPKFTKRFITRSKQILDATDDPTMTNMNQMTTLSGLPASHFVQNSGEKVAGQSGTTATTAATTPPVKKKSEKEKKQERRRKFFRRYAMLMAFTPLILYWRDNKKARENCQLLASRITGTNSDEIRRLIQLSKINNNELIDFYVWLVNEYNCDSMTIDEFGNAYSRAIDVMDKRRKKQIHGTQNDQDIAQIEKEKEMEKEKEKNEKQREKDNDLRLFSKSKKIEFWDLNMFFRSMNIYQSSKIDLNLLFVAISQLSKQDFTDKCEVAFRVVSSNISNDIDSDSDDLSNISMSKSDVIDLLDAMMLTGHFTTKTLVVKSKYFPSEYRIRNAHEIANIIYNECGIENKYDNITLEQFKDALYQLAKGLKWYEKAVNWFLPLDYKPHVQVWYCSQMEHMKVNERKNEIQRLKKLKEHEEEKQQGQKEQQGEGGSGEK